MHLEILSVVTHTKAMLTKNLWQVLVFETKAMLTKSLWQV